MATIENTDTANGVKICTLNSFCTDVNAEYFSADLINQTITFHVNQGGILNSGPDTVEAIIIFNNNNISSLNTIYRMSLSVDAITWHNTNLSTEKVQITVESGYYDTLSGNFTIFEDGAVNSSEWEESVQVADSWGFTASNLNWTISENCLPAFKLTIISTKSNAACKATLSVYASMQINQVGYYYIFRDADEFLARFTNKEEDAAKSYIPEKSGYKFTGWSDGTTFYPKGTLPGVSIPYPIDRVLTAVWESLLPVTINVLSSPEGAGTVTGSGTYISGEICTITAAPNVGYMFADPCATLETDDGSMSISIKDAIDATIMAADRKSFSWPLDIADGMSTSITITLYFEREPGSNVYIGSTLVDAYVGTTLLDVYVGNTLI